LLILKKRFTACSEKQSKSWLLAKVTK